MGFCPNENLFERSLKRFFINLGEVIEKQFQIVDPDIRVAESPRMSLRFIKKCYRAAKNDRTISCLEVINYWIKKTP
jgi:hypothetical protein